MTELGYVSNGVARALATRRTRTTGHGPARNTVTGIVSPCSEKMAVMPIFSPKIALTGGAGVLACAGAASALSGAGTAPGV